MKKSIVLLGVLCMLISCCNIAAFADDKAPKKPQEPKYWKEVQTNQFRAHGGDKRDFTDTMKEVVKNLDKPEVLKKYIAPTADEKAILAYLKELTQYKDIQFDQLYFIKFYQVADHDEYHCFRGIAEFKFVGKDKAGKMIERTDLLAVAKLGKETTDWKIWDVIWKDTGIDVSDVKLFQLDPPKKGEEICIMKTEAGVIKMRLFPEKAPLAVKNFKGLAEKDYYDNMIFSRVINDFVIQSGALDGSGKEAESIYNGFFKDEFNRDLFNFRGALCLGNNGPNTNGNQFYIVQKPTLNEEHVKLSALPMNAEAKYKEIGGLPYLDKRYTVFGQVFEGIEVVDKIAAQKTDDEGMPVKDPIKILDIEFKKYE
ncbi:MAG: peptidylprolyl isomerase [Peptostreptococcaceae bacterium]|nr:peptidylprolyl isomerase [Peptostreptococcaceae bacterium]